MPKKYVALTGACGFIGRHVCQQLLARGDYVYAVDCLTYAADPLFPGKMQREYPDHFCFINNDIRHLGRWPDVDAVLHLAAESHVDNSLDTPNAFIETNVNGTLHLLEMTRRKKQQHRVRFIYVSTDEVYGDVSEVDEVTQSPTRSFAADPLRPSSPYAASKAAADLMVQAWGRTYGIDWTVIRPSNCYGLGQYAEKLVPRTIRACALGRPITIHGDGTQLRQWLWVEDCASAILFTLDHAPNLPRIVNIAGNTEAVVGGIATQIAYHMGVSATEDHEYDRPGQDMRYAVDDTPLREAGWEPKGDFWRDLPGIVEQERKSFRF